MTRSAWTHCLVAAIGLVSLAGSATAQTQITTYQYEYDANGNLTKVTDPLLYVTVYGYDSLNRKRNALDPNLKPTSFDYDNLDQLKQVKDARGLVTLYTVDGLGNRTEMLSPDTGSTVNTYDDSGNVLTARDAKNQTTQFAYDVLNRLKTITYADLSAVTYLYDQGPNAIGRLSKITDASGSIEYAYDDWGRVASEIRTIGGQAFTTSYRFDAYGRPAGMRYPSGRSIDYTYEAHARLAQITTTYAGTTTTLITAVSYQPFGPVRSFTFGNGQTQTRSYDLDGRMASYTLGGKTMVLGYDGASHITSIADAADGANGSTYGYDPLDRLTKVLSPTVAQTYSYDEVGNRKQKGINGAVTNQGYASTSNRLTTVGSQPIAIDPNGSITDKGNATFNYDARGRMVGANTLIGQVQYVINGLGQRVRKTTPTDTTVFHYDAGGRLIAESTTTGAITRTQEYVYLGNMPVAVLK